MFPLKNVARKGFKVAQRRRAWLWVDSLDWSVEELADSINQRCYATFGFAMDFRWIGCSIMSPRHDRSAISN